MMPVGNRENNQVVKPQPMILELEAGSAVSI